MRTYYPSYKRKEEPGWSEGLTRSALALVAALLAVLALSVLVAPGQARAASQGVEIIFTSPIYAGQNNGDPEGPVATQVAVAGSGWTGSSAVTLALADRNNDTKGDSGSACTNGSPTIALPNVAPATVMNGDFTATFPWPAQAGTQGHAYWVCGTQDGTPEKGAQAFTVLSPLPPSVGVSAAQVPLGGTVTVTGQNWLPGSSPKYNQKIGVVLAPCVACDPGGPNFVSSTTVSAQADGTFSVSLPLPPGAKVGDKLYVSAQSMGDGSISLPAATLNTGVSTAANITVTDQPTATPAPSATPGVTTTAQASATVAAGGNGGGNNTSNTSGNTLLLVLLLALGGVLLLAAAVALILFMRSRNPAPVGAGRGGPGYGGHSTYYGQDGGSPDQGGYSRSGPSRRGTRSDSPYTNEGYYSPPPAGGRPPRAGGRSGPPGAYPGRQGGWSNPPDPRGYPPGPDDDQFGDAPTVGTETPWQH
ncbi:MAG TPA: hypothetical protein VH540_01965 [Ktedonobacterales bacterium]